jgi:3-oxoadipate enol-lactonase
MPSPSVATQSIEHQGADLRYLVRGEGAALVFVHGHPFDSSMWRPQIDEFASSMRVIVPDLRGYGHSSAQGSTTSLSVFADDLAALLDHLGADDAVMCGLSMGGQIVMQFLSTYPARVRGLILADTTPQGETEDSARERRAMAGRLEREGMESYAREVLPMMVDPDNIRDLPAVADHVMAMMLNAPPRGAAAAQRGRAERPDYWDVLAGATQPALVVVGENDEYTPVSVAQRMAAELHQASVTVVPGCAHLPNLERPDRFNAEVRQFLGRLS